MKPTNVLQLLAGSIAVYMLMAACSGAGSGGFGTSGDGGSTRDGSHGDDGAALVDGSGVGDALLDSIMNPVGDARADVNVSGSRLKARNYVGTDGSKQWMGWHDDQRNEDCAYLTAADGSARCLPVGAYLYPTYFTDPGCSQAIYLATKGCMPLPYALSSVATSTCNDYRVHVYPFGPAFTGAQAYYKSGASCSAIPSSSLSATYDLYSLGTEVDPASFVAATIQVGP